MHLGLFDKAIAADEARRRHTNTLFAERSVQTTTSRRGRYAADGNISSRTGPIWVFVSLSQGSVFPYLELLLDTLLP
jgi:hypothetical protein